MLRTGDVLVWLTVTFRHPATNPVDSRYSISVCRTESMETAKAGGQFGGWDSRPALLFASQEMPGKLHKTG